MKPITCELSSLKTCVVGQVGDLRSALMYEMKKFCLCMLVQCWPLGAWWHYYWEQLSMLHLLFTRTVLLVTLSGF